MVKNNNYLIFLNKEITKIEVFNVDKKLIGSYLIDNKWLQIPLYILIFEDRMYIRS